MCPSSKTIQDLASAMEVKKVRFKVEQGLENEVTFYANDTVSTIYYINESGNRTKQNCQINLSAS